MIGTVWLSPKGGIYSVMRLRCCGEEAVLVGQDHNTHASLEELLANWEPVPFEAGSTWKHKKSGKLYGIVLVANRDSDRADFDLTINYISDELKLHACSAASFYRRMEKVV